MRFCSIVGSEQDRGAVMSPGGGVLPFDALARISGQPLPSTLEAVISAGRQPISEALALCSAADLESAALDPQQVRFAPPLRRPGKIWGIGLNYRAHAGDLSEQVPAEPASFMKPFTAIVAPGEPIVLPPQSDRVTAEAEIALIIGSTARNVSAEAAPDYVFGVTTVIDMTAEDILRRNPRFLTRAKSFDTFFSFGPWVVTLDELPDIHTLTVRTVVNGEVRAENSVSQMTFPPYELVRFHSEVMTLLPGDIISTGTPGAAVIRHGDLAEAQVEMVGRLVNPVIDGRNES